MEAAVKRPGESRRFPRDSYGGTAKPFRSHSRSLTSQRGVTVVELLIVLIIMGVILGALTTLFVRGMKAELAADQRFRAQDQARLAVDRMRREIHCASAITSTATSVTATLPGHCPSAVGGRHDDSRLQLPERRYEPLQASPRGERRHGGDGGRLHHDRQRLHVRGPLVVVAREARCRLPGQRQADRGLADLAAPDGHRAPEHDPSLIRSNGG